MEILEWDKGIYCVQCIRKSLNRVSHVGNHPARELSERDGMGGRGGGGRGGRKVGRGRERWRRWRRVEKRDSVEEAGTSVPTRNK